MTAAPTWSQYLATAADVLAGALSHGRRRGARLVAGAGGAFATDLSVVYAPHVAEPVDGVKPLTYVTAGIALQASPTKETLARLLAGDERDVRILEALQFVEGEAALGWVVDAWPGLAVDLRRLAAGAQASDLRSEAEFLEVAESLVRAGRSVDVPPIFGLPPADRPLSTKAPWSCATRAAARLPWSRRSKHRRVRRSVPIGGRGGEQAPRTGPPAATEPDLDESSTSERRIGVRYPEWNEFRREYRSDWVTVMERRPARAVGGARSNDGLTRLFIESPVRAWRGRREDGPELDVAAYVDAACRQLTGEPTDGWVYRAIEPGPRDVATALLLDASASLQVKGGEAFKLELACAQSLSDVMVRTGERFGVFAFTGETRHRVEMWVLRDFFDPPLPVVLDGQLTPSGYTRLGAAVRDVTARLSAVPAQRRVLISIGDGLPSDEGYEGAYAEGDVARAVAEAVAAGVVVYHLGVGTTARDPLPRTFGCSRSRRIASAAELPAVLARIHRELVDV